MVDFLSNLNLEEDGKRLAILDINCALNYIQLLKIVDEFCDHIDKSRIVFIIGSNSINTISYYLACLKKGAIPLLLPENIKNKKLIEYTKRFSPFSIFSDKKLAIDCDKLKFFNGSYIYFYNEYFSSASAIPSLLLTTSGSTGSPKVVVLSEENIINNTKSIVDYLSISSKDRHITTLPFNYTYGLSCINTHLYSKASIVLNNYSVITSDFWELVRDKEPTTISGVPYTYEMLCRLGINNLPLDTIEKFTQAGGKLSNKYLKIMSNFVFENNKEFFVMYGQTEATARMSYLPSKYLIDKIGSIGIPIPGGSFYLNNTKEYNKVSNLSVGELIYSGPNVCLGYATNCQDIAKNFNPRYSLETGDLAYVDNDGFYYICGRKSRFAKISGNRFSLDDIQELVPDKFKSAVVSDDINIYVFIEADDHIDLKGIKSLILNNIDINPILLKIKLLDNLPRTESGKIIFNKLL